MSSNLSQLIMKLLPRGDCWQFESLSLFSRIAQGLSAEFLRVNSRIDAIVEAFFPKTPTSGWKDSLLFQPYSQGLYTLSTHSIQAQLHFYNITNVEMIAPPEEPFMLYIHINPVNEHYFSAGDEVGNELYHWRDEKLEDLLSNLLPAFCKQTILYRSMTDA